MRFEKEIFLRDITFLILHPIYREKIIIIAEAGKN